MTARRSLERLLRTRILGPTIEDQLAEEIALHVELLARELMEDGMTAAQAHAEAERRFSDRRQLAASCARIARATERRLRWTVYLGELRQDVHYGLRQLARAPSFAAVALLTLAAGIGATTGIFSVVEGVVLRRFPFAHPERVATVLEAGSFGDGDVSAGNFLDLLPAAAHSFSEMGAETFAVRNLAEGDVPERVLAAPVTSGFFAVFGVHPLFGRTFAAEEDQPGRDQVAVLSHALWKEHLGADRAILGRTLHLSGRGFRVIGVMPPGFDPTLSHEDLWLPMAWTPTQRAEHDEHYLTVVGLLRPGVSPTAAQAGLTPAMLRIAERFPTGNIGRRGVHVMPLSDLVIGSYRQRLFVLLGAVGLVLLIACANVASLLLARGSARGRELAIRTAIGAGGRRIARQLLTESAVLALAGGALGVGLAAAALRLFIRLAPAGIPRLADARIDGGVLLFALAVSMACSLLFGMAPALRSARQDPQTLLRGGTAGPGPARDRLRSLLVLAEVALALTLLMGAGLLIRSALHLARTSTGFDTANLLAARVTLPESAYSRPAKAARTFAELAERLAHAPGVRAAAAVSAAPLERFGGSNGLLPEGKPLTPENLIQSNLHIVTPAYFETMRIPLVAGRVFEPGDVAGRARVMIVSRELARRAWGSAAPIGKRISCCEGGPDHPMWKTVVGVVGDVRTHGPAEQVMPEFYLPIGQAPPPAWDWIQRTMTLVARGRDSRVLAGAMRAVVRGVDPSLPLSKLTTMDAALRGTLAEARFHTLLLLCLGLLGLFLAAVGIYGVIAYFASLRTHEIGIRIALGARRWDVLTLLAWQGALPLGGGLLAGTGGALAATRWLQGSLHGVSATDPLTFSCVVAVLAATASLAILIPALGAARVDPRSAIQQP